MKWIIPLTMAGIATLLLFAVAVHISGFGEGVIYAATWIVLLHVFIGEYVLVRYLHSTSRNQRILDLLAFVLLCGNILSFSHPALWCAFLAGVMALAIVKYILIEERQSITMLKRYAREKVRWESPAVVLFSLLALLFAYLPDGATGARVLKVAILAIVAAFAVWMIWIRHIYRWIIDARS